MTEFTMSMYANKEDLLRAKVNYFESLARAALERLEELEEVRQDDNGDWYWVSCGEPIKYGS